MDILKITKGQRLAVSGILVAIALILRNINILSDVVLQQTITNVIMIVAAIIAGTPILKNAISAARYCIIGIDALVSIAVIGAMFIGEYWEAAAVTFLFMLGEYLESRTIEKTRSSIKS